MNIDRSRTSAGSGSCVDRAAAAGRIRVWSLNALALAAMIVLLSAPGRARATLCCNPSTNQCTVLVTGSCASGFVAVAGTTCSPNPCFVQWTIGPWGSCSASCGPGTQARSVVCTIGGTVLPDSQCAVLGPKPPTVQSCNLGSCAQWTVGPWGSCSTTCGPGTQTRTVTCTVNGTVVADSQCASAGPRPPASQACNPGACTGACCQGSICSVLQRAPCEAALGLYRGDLVACNPPNDNVLPCCKADFNGSGGITVQDIFDFLAAYFGGDLRADINQSGGLSVQDIFDFLAAYFAGCA